LCAALVLASCQGHLETLVPQASSRTGKAVIRTEYGTDTTPRTILPAAPVFSRYELTLTKAGSEAVTPDTTGIDGAGVTVELESGDWTAAVQAYRQFTVDGGAAKEYLAAKGSAPLLVTAGSANRVTVTLEPVPIEAAEGAKGVFSWDILLPEGLDGAELRLGDAEPVDLRNAPRGSLEMDAGAYNLFIIMEKGGLNAGLYEWVYIYPGLESRAAFDFRAGGADELAFANEVLLAGTALVNALLTNSPGVEVGSLTVSAYSDAACTNTLDSVDATNNAWLLSIPVDRIGQPVYLTLSAEENAAYAPPADDYLVEALPRNGQPGIALSLRFMPGGEITGLDGVLQVGETAGPITAATAQSGTTVWSSGNVSVATIDPGTGVVTLAGAGDAAIGYSVTTGNTVVSNSAAIHVYAAAAALAPAYDALTGPAGVTVLPANAGEITAEAGDNTAAFAIVNGGTNVTTINPGTGRLTLVDSGTVTVSLAITTAEGVVTHKGTSASITVEKTTAEPDQGPNGLYRDTVFLYPYTIAQSLAWLEANAVAGGNYTVKRTTGEETLNPTDLSSKINKNNVSLTIEGLGDPTEDETAWPVVQLDSTNGALFTVGKTSGSTQTLILDGRLILKGTSTNNASLVQVNAAGALAMRGNAKITGNTTTDTNSCGGGVRVEGGTFTMSGNASVSGNSANSGTYNGGGGGVFVIGGTFIMSGSTSVSDNTASNGSGGGVHVTNNGTFTMSGSASVSDNAVTSDGGFGSVWGGGGGVYVYGDGVSFTMGDNASVSANTVTTSGDGGDGGGGGVFVPYGTFIMNGGTISGNTATSSSSFSQASIRGGGVYAKGGTFTMNGGTISGNTATSTSTPTSGNAYANTHGGGVAAAGSTFTMNGGTISDNTATAIGIGIGIGTSIDAWGGGVYGHTFTMNGGTISGNTTVSPYYAQGGGVFSYEAFTMNGGAISGNTATAGGGVFSYDMFTMNGGTISGNTATTDGGGVYFYRYYTSGTFIKTGGVITGSPTRLLQHSVGANSHTAGHADHDDCNVAASGRHALYSSPDNLTIGGVTSPHFTDDLGENDLGGSVVVPDSPDPLGNYLYPGTGITYQGAQTGGTGTVSANSAVNITYPVKTAFDADGFFSLKGTVNDSAMNNYAYVRVCLGTDTSNSNPNSTWHLVRGAFETRIWLRFGAGTYTVEVWDLTTLGPASTLPAADADYSSFGGSIAHTFTVNNTRNEDGRFIYPSYLCQSDDPSIIALAQNLAAGKATDTDKVRAIHDYLITNTFYDNASLTPGQRKKQNALYCLAARYAVSSQYASKGGHYLAVCEGYSNIMAAMLRVLGIETKVIGSPVINHAWNNVLVDGTWKFLDATWDDPFTNSAHTTDLGPNATSLNTATCNAYFLTALSGYGNNDHPGGAPVSRSVASPITRGIQGDGTVWATNEGWF
jgi:hypothetical protein